MTQRFESLLNQQPEMRNLLDKVKQMNSLQRHFNSVTNPRFVAACRVMGLHYSVLTVAVNNSSIAAKLRQMEPELVVSLKNRGCEVSGIRFKVQVENPTYEEKTAPRKISSNARTAFDELEKTLPDSPLKRAVAKLVSSKY
jgi:hypothetical protein